RAGRALLTFAPTTPVGPARLLSILRARPRRTRLVRDFVLEVAVPAGPWSAVRTALLDFCQGCLPAEARTAAPGSPPASQKGAALQRPLAAGSHSSPGGRGRP
ncbi:MAG TPA: hypothetical protein VLD61_07730, partial [Methylomirabilota bacterium]|nr:hypothetical protein [Methylomirabilota bacterium]